MKNSLFFQCVRCYDRLWRRRNKVERIDQLISVSFQRFTGERTPMNDGTWIESGDHLAILHFNHDCFGAMDIHSGGYARAALRFRRLLVASFNQLATLVVQDTKFATVKAFHGISWLPPHGEKIGFMVERLPNTLINQLRKFYFRILLKTFFPALALRTYSIQPYAYWLTRNSLLKHFAAEGRNEA